MKHLKTTEAGEQVIQKKLQSLSKDALAQIDENQYEEELVLHGVESILKIGIAFHKKWCEISYQLDRSEK